MSILGIIASSISGNLDAGDFESIATTTLTTSTADITFSSIPGTYTHLQVRGIVRDTVSSADTMLRWNVNGVTDSAKYMWHDLTADGATVYAGSGVGQGDTYFRNIRYPGALSTASAFGVFVLDVLDYTNTNKNTTFRTLGGYDANGSGWVALTSAVYLETTAITSIKISSGATAFAQYSSFALYGIRSA